jgi:L-seryl-tRNA(Ser) seleniumtransferase
MTLDLEAERRGLEAKVDEMKQALGALKGLALETFVPEIANHVPHLRLTWDEPARGLTAKQVHEQLQAGDPPVHVLLPGPGALTVSVWMMQGEEHRLVARRLRDLLERA